jgi:hypothetical protein
VCIHIFGCVASGGGHEKLGCLLLSLDTSVFDFHGEDSGSECQAAEV